jgi:hypothetical protein
MSDIVPASAGAVVPADDLYAPPDASDPAWQRALHARTDSERELLLARFLVEKSLEKGSPSTTAQLLALASKLVEVRRQEREEDGSKFTREQLREQCAGMIEAVASVLRERVPDWEDVLRDIVFRIDPNYKPWETK